MKASVDDLVTRAAAFPRLVVITGAGLSTASGIGDYRDSQGAWKRRPPVQMQDFMRDPATRRRYWARSMLGWPSMARARANAAHTALVSLEAGGRLGGLITQNVDGLHQQAGHRTVIELHGRLADVICMACGAGARRAAVQAWLEEQNGWLLGARAPAAPDGDADLADSVDLDRFRVPACAACGGVLKPDVVFYGDTVPRERVARAFAMVEAADALLVAGSSLMVYSSFRLCRRAYALGMPIFAVNRGVTRADPLITLKVEDDCTTVLPALAAALLPSAEDQLRDRA